MRILIATAGSRGDVAPFTGLGARLQAAGHQVAVATHATFAASVRTAGLDFRPLPVDPRAELASAEGRRLLQAGTGPRAVLQLLQLGRKFMPELADGIADATALGTDLLLTTSTTGPLGQVAAEAAGIPSIGLHLQPLSPTREFAPAVPIGSPASASPPGRYHCAPSPPHASPPPSARPSTTPATATGPGRWPPPSRPRTARRRYWLPSTEQRLADDGGQVTVNRRRRTDNR